MEGLFWAERLCMGVFAEVKHVKLVLRGHFDNRSVFGEPDIVIQGSSLDEVRVLHAE